MSRLLVVALLGAQGVLAAPLDDAIALALAEDARLAALRAEVRQVNRQSGWSSEVRLAANAQSTRDTAAGLDAGLTVTIPLFDRKQKIAAAQTRYRLSTLRQELRRTLMAACAALVAQAGEVIDAVDLAAFYRDRLAYEKQAVAEGRTAADGLWVVAKQVRDAGQAATAAAQAYAVQLETVARSWGGEQWMTLRDLLAAHVKQNWPSMPSPVAATSW